VFMVTSGEVGRNWNLSLIGLSRSYGGSSTSIPDSRRHSLKNIELQTMKYRHNVALHDITRYELHEHSQGDRYIVINAQLHTFQLNMCSQNLSCAVPKFALFASMTTFRDLLQFRRQGNLTKPSTSGLPYLFPEFPQQPHHIV
jgi:hypothetical protein